MAISEYKPREEYVGTGLLKTYSFDFKITVATQLELIVTDDEYVEQFRVRGDDGTYLSSIAINAVEGGSIVLVDELPLNYHLVIQQAASEPIQPSQFTNNAGWTLKQFEAALDYLALELQSVANLANRSLKLNIAQLDTDSVNTEVERLVAGAVIAINDDEDGFEMVPRSVFKGDKGDTGDQGEQGIQGDQGDQGIQGVAGNDGTNSLGIHTQAGAPTAGDGVDGDFWINTTNGDYYLKAAGAWTLKGNLTGPQGIQGIQGNVGDTGPEGSQIYNDTGDPNDVGGIGGIYPGVEGDFYIDQASPNKYYQFASGLWDLRGQFGGANGGGFDRLDMTVIATQVQTIPFDVPMPDDQYILTYSILNQVDDDPIFLNLIVIEQTVDDFTVKFNAPPDSVNYVLSWGVTQHV